MNATDPWLPAARSAAEQPTLEPLDPRLRDLYRSATPTQKLAIVARLNATLIGLKEADLRACSVVRAPNEQRKLLRSWCRSAAIGSIAKKLHGPAANWVWTRSGKRHRTSCEPV